MNWKKPTPQNHPPFKRIVLGLKFPNAVSLVKLQKIDETGPVFVKAEEGDDSDTALLNNIFGRNPRIEIDMYSEIELPEPENSNSDEIKSSTK